MVKTRTNANKVVSLVAGHFTPNAADPRPPKLNVIVSGDTHFHDEAMVRQSLDELHARDLKRPIAWVILGGGDRLVDRVAWSWANKHHVRIYGYQPKWCRYGRGAGSKVNQQLIRAKFDTKVLLVFLGEDVSPTTKDLIRRATKAGMEVVQKGAVMAEPRP